MRNTPRLKKLRFVKKSTGMFYNSTWHFKIMIRLPRDHNKKAKYMGGLSTADGWKTDIKKSNLTQADFKDQMKWISEK